MTAKQDYSLTEDEQQYLNERGFEIVDDSFHPWFVDERPVLTLNSLPISEDEPENPGVKYWTNNNSGTRSDNTHPSKQSDDELIQIIEKTVASNKMWEGDFFTTEPGHKFKVYVIDQAWQGVAEKLVDKYQ